MFFATNRLGNLLLQDGGDGGYDGGGFVETPVNLNYNGLPDTSPTAGSSTMTNNGFDPSTGGAAIAPPTSLDLNAGIGTIGSGGADPATSQGTATSSDATGGTSQSVFNVALLPDNATIAANSRSATIQTAPDTGGSVPWDEIGKGVGIASSLAATLNSIFNSTGGSAGAISSPGKAGAASTSAFPAIGGKSAGAVAGSPALSGSVKSALDSILGPNNPVSNAIGAPAQLKQTDTLLLTGLAVVIGLMLFRH